MFVPATIACVTPARRRNGTLRATVVACLVSAIAGSVFFGAVFAFVMAPPTALLAQAAGLIFQGPAKR